MSRAEGNDDRVGYPPQWIEDWDCEEDSTYRFSEPRAEGDAVQVDASERRPGHDSREFDTLAEARSWLEHHLAKALSPSEVW